MAHINTLNTMTPKNQPNFSCAFQQMASFVAIAKTRATSEALRELIFQCYVVLPNEPLSTADEIVEAIQVLFGIPINSKDISKVLSDIIKKGEIINIGNGQLSLSPDVMIRVSTRIETAKALEKDVQETWLKQICINAPTLDGEKIWAALQSYLQQSFRRHGIQAVELLNPEVEFTNSNSNHSLSNILDDIIITEFSAKNHQDARQSIVSFFQTVSSDRKRAEYIASLADAAFNYFSLAVAPEISEKLRDNLNELILFLDTNFIFGILNLHVNSQVDVSRELLDVIKKFRLPFRLRYHEATVREMTNTLYFYGQELCAKKWPQKISRAIVTSGALSGIELRYHTKNENQPISVEDFLAPYKHWQILLKDKGIDVYNTTSSDAHLRARADLESEYKDYLKDIQREKPVEAIQHDMSVLETVQALRTNTRTTLDAGALLVTCDYNLFRFDFERSRKNNQNYTTILPNLLWQILRPYVSDNDEFNRAFAETFALPEFSLGRGGAQRAAARMASILAGYSDIPEETASKMLANDFLITELQKKETDADFIQTIESEIAAYNVQLAEERAAMAIQLKREKDDHELSQQKIVETSRQVEIYKQLGKQQEQELKQKDETIKSLQEENVNQQQYAKQQIDKENDENERRRKNNINQFADKIANGIFYIVGILFILIYAVSFFNDGNKWSNVPLVFLGFLSVWTGFSGRTIKQWVKKKIAKFLLDKFSV